MRLLAGVLILALSAASAFAEVLGAGQHGLLQYTSNIDGSTQDYGLFVPDSYNPDSEGGVPLVIHGGGYGHVAGDYSYSSYLNSYNAIFLDYDGRSCLQYDGVAEKDLFQLLGELETNYNIDTNRIFFEGHSMGSTGAMRIGFRHPDVFAAVAGGAGFLDYNEWYERWYAQGPTGSYRTEYAGPEYRRPLLEESSVVDLAENGKHLFSYFTAGSLDTTNRPYGARNLNNRLNELGYDHFFFEYPTQGHNAGYNGLEAISYFLDQGITNDPYVPDVVYKTNQLKYNEAYWTRIDRLNKHLDWAQIQTSITPEENRIDVNVDNITQYTLDISDGLIAANNLSASSPINVYTNGQLSYSGSAGQVTLYQNAGTGGSSASWSTTNTFTSTLVKTHDIEGPIGHAFVSPFELLYGDGSGREAARFAEDWNNPTYMNAQVRPVHYSQMTQDMVDKKNLILFGTASNNAVMNKVMFDQSLPFNLPITVTDDVISIAGRTYDTAEYGLFMVYPNPMNPDHYVVVSEGTVFDSNLGWEIESMPWAWPDYVIFDKDFVYDPETMSTVQGYPFMPSSFVEVGYFDNNWQVVPEPATLVLLSIGLGALAFRSRKKMED